MKTPEQSLNEFIEFYVNRIDRSEDGLVEECLNDGAKWQAERMYSEEEVLDITKQAYAMGRSNCTIQAFNKWFEQVKK